MRNILIVNEDMRLFLNYKKWKNNNTKYPSGVLTVIEEYCSYAAVYHKVFILFNFSHWANDFLKKKNHLLKVNNMPIIVPAELYILLRKILPNFISKIIYLAYSPLIFLLNLIYIIFYIRINGINVIYSHNGGWPGGQLNITVIIAAKICFVKNIFLCVHNLPVKNKKYKLFSYLREEIINFCVNNIITVSHGCRDELIRHTNLKKIIVIYNGISNINFPINYQVNSLSKKTIIYIGEIHERKGLDVLVDALKMIDVDFNFIVVGSGQDQYVSNFIKKLNGINYQFLGFSDKVYEAIALSDFLVLPSISYESFGMVLVEAMRQGVPSICTDIGGMKEVITNKINGLVVKAGDVIELSNAINKLLTDNDLLKKMAKNSYKKYISMFNSEKMYYKYDALLRK